MTIEQKLLVLTGLVIVSTPAIVAWTNRRSMHYRLKATAGAVLGSMALVVFANAFIDTMNA